MTTTPPPSAKARLRRALIDEVDGKRSCVLVLGDGLNQQAAGAAKSSAWDRVLAQVWHEAAGSAQGFAPADRAPAATWAFLVAAWASHHRVGLTRAQQAVRTRVCAAFERFESASRPKRLYASLLDGRFANLVSFSVDRRFILQAGAARVTRRRAHDPFLEQRFDVSAARGTTRVWFPYGETGRPASLDPGHTAYDLRLMALERVRSTLMDENNRWDAGHGPGLMPPISVWPQRWATATSWAELVLCAPLVFIGTSLPADDWPLWWLLHQRARYFVPFEDWQVVDSFVLTSRPADFDHVARGAAGLEMVGFKDDDALWAFVADALAAPGVDQSPGWKRTFRPRR